MSYILDFCVASLFFFSVTVFFYFRQNRVSNMRNNIFGVMLVLCLLMLIFDFFTAALNPCAAAYPAVFLYALNIIFLFLTHTCTMLFTLYSCVISGIYPSMTRIHKVILIIPLALVTILLLISPFTDQGIFYLAEDHSYQHGACHIALYISAAIYSISGLICVLIARKSIQKRKVKIVFSFIAISIVAMLIQFFNSRILVNSTAVAISFTMMYFGLQTPSEHIDPVTGALNRGALTDLVYEAYEQNQKFSLVIIQALSIRSLTTTLGSQIMNLFHKQFSTLLQKQTPFGTVFRIANDTYSILLSTTDLSVTKLESIKSSIPGSWEVNGIHIPIVTCVAGVVNNDCSDANIFLTAIDYFIHQNKFEENNILLTNKNFFSDYEHSADVETEVKNTIRNKAIDILYQPVSDKNGSVFICEAIIRASSNIIGNLSESQIVSVAEKNNLIIELDTIILEKVCAFISRGMSKFAPKCSVSINLSIIDCMQRDLAERVAAIVSSYEINPAMLAFGIHEAEAEIDLPQVRENILALHKAGHVIIANYFGSGFTDFPMITKLPVAIVKIDKSFISAASKKEKQKVLLAGILSVVSKLGLRSICAGIETYEQSSTAKAVDFTYYQGSFYTAPLTDTDLIQYVKTQNFLDQLNNNSISNK